MTQAQSSANCDAGKRTIDFWDWCHLGSSLIGWWYNTDLKMVVKRLLWMTFESYVYFNARQHTRSHITSFPPLAYNFLSATGIYITSVLPLATKASPGTKSRRSTLSPVHADTTIPADIPDAAWNCPVEVIRLLHRRNTKPLRAISLFRSQQTRRAPSRPTQTCAPPFQLAHRNVRPFAYLSQNRRAQAPTTSRRRACGTAASLPRPPMWRARLPTLARE